MRRLTFLCAVFLFVCGMTVHAQAALEFPALTGRVVDQADVLSAEAAAGLDAKLADFETRTGLQVVVATLNDLGGTDIADYSYQLGRHWRIGQAGKNNGVIILMAPSTRDVRIEVGYGLEGALTDAASSVIINSIMIPRFKQGDLSGGLIAGTDAVLSVIQGEGAPLLQQAAGKQATDSPWLAILIFLLIFWLISRRGGGRSSGLAPFIIGSMLGSSGGRGGFGGGGFSGGGGSFGGGGASGRW